jgi:hypothetical protein
LIPRPLRAGAAAALLALVAACATAPAIAVNEPRELAGAWRGRLTGPSGSAIAALTIKEDGSFAGTMYLDGEDKDFSGAITVVRPGQVRYRSSQGFGRVVLEDQGGTRALIFRPDGGGVASVFAPVR